MLKRLANVVGLVVLTHGSPGWAQLAQPGVAAPIDTAPDATAASPQPLPSTASSIQPELPRVVDPMLARPPPAPRVLRSWQQALQALRSRSTLIRSAEARIAEAEGQRRQTLAAALPRLAGTGNLTRHLLLGEGTRLTPGGALQSGSIPNPATTWQATLGLRVPLFAPQAWYDHDTWSEVVRNARLSAKDAERLALLDVADAIVQVVTAERLAEVSRVSLEFALANLDLNQRRARLGAATRVDVLRAQQEVELARAQVIAADEALSQSREQLGLALGSHEPHGVRADVRLDGLASDARAFCRVEANVDARADIRAAETNVTVAERNTSSVSRTYLPTVDLASDLTYLSHTVRSPNAEHVTWTIGALLSWDLYDGGLRYGLRETNQARVRLAQEDLTERRRQARLEVARATRAVSVAQQNLAVSQRSREVARETARLSRVAFVNGSGTSFELVDTGRRLREAELDLAVKEFDVVRARLAALLALASCDV